MIKKAVLKILLAILAVVVLCFVWAPAGYVAKDLLGFDRHSQSFHGKQSLL